jgi:uncharacterized integral membrane protein
MLRKVVAALFLVPLSVLVIGLSVANRGAVTLAFNPLDPSAAGFTVSVPLFLILFAAVGLGVLIGGVAAWLRQGSWRHAARVARDEADSLRAERDRLKSELAIPARGKPAAVPMLPPAA